MFSIASTTLERIIHTTNFKNDGDGYEQEFSGTVSQHFSRCETFWRTFVVPCTNRVNETVTDRSVRIRYREEISPDIKEVCAQHYSVFLNLIYAHDHLSKMRVCSFEDFYFHLGSVCDLAEDFLTKVYLIQLECLGKHANVLAGLSRDEFRDLAGDWYDKNYRKLEEYYLKKGKSLPLKIPSRVNILDEYFGPKHSSWSDYKGFTRLIREYRNVITHQPQIGKLYTIQGAVYVPKKNVIQNYRTWQEVFAVGSNQTKFRQDFISMRKQMESDFVDLQQKLEQLWIRVIDDLSVLLFESRNDKFLAKYDLLLV